MSNTLKYLTIIILMYSLGGCQKKINIIRSIEEEEDILDINDTIDDIIEDKDTNDVVIDTTTDNGGNGTEISEEELIRDVIYQSDYQKEEFGAPPRPSWNDLFRHYPEQEFFKQGRYVLSWSKYAGNKGHNAERWELWQITFKDPANITTTHGLTVDDIKDVNVIFEDRDIEVYTYDQEVVLPNNLLLPDIYSSESSTLYAPPVIVVNNNTQTGYFPINYEKNGRASAVGYKIRCFRTVIDTDDHGNIVEKEMYNDSHVLIVKYKDAQFGNAGGISTDGDTTGQLAIEDELKTMDDVRNKLGFSSNQNFTQSWENIKSSTSPVTNLITKDEWDRVLFPNRQAHSNFHDKDGTYYTYENFVEAAKYFPNFLSEGSLEDRYRELAAFLGHKSHEVGDGWEALGEERWSYGLVWIEEISYYGTTMLGYRQEGHPDYPPTNGKSYHGRGPVQLSWNYNYGMMSEMLFGDKSILLDNPSLLAKDGFLGFVSAIWFWMQPQNPKPSCHDVMVGNVELSKPYNAPTSSSKDARTHTSNSKGWNADGTPVSYSGWRVPNGAEVGYGLTINIINGGLESGTFDGRHGRRLGYFARYLDYFGTTKLGKNEPISPQPPKGGDIVPDKTVQDMKNWRNWHRVPQDLPQDMPSILVSRYASPF